MNKNNEESNEMAMLGKENYANLMEELSEKDRKYTIDNQVADWFDQITAPLTNNGKIKLLVFLSEKITTTDPKLNQLLNQISNYKA